MIPTIDHARKIVDLLSHGLVKGLGKPEPGKMCVEAAVCYALGLPHSDNPPCVGEAVREFKIELNDQDWPSNMARAKGMAKLAIAQLGSNTIDQGEFKKKVFWLTHKRIIPLSFDYMREECRRPEHEELKKFVMENDDIEKLRRRFSSYYSCSYYDYYSYYSYSYDYYYDDDYEPEFAPIMLNLMAEIGVEALQELKSPGCEWLHLIEESSKV